MLKLPLITGWMLLDQEPQGDTPDTRAVTGSNDWMTVAVPGDVNATLVQHGRMPDPLVDTQGRQCYWVSGKDWWYRLTFDANQIVAGQADLCLTSVDGTADVWLNGQHLGVMRNAFRQFRFAVGPLLKPTGNELLLRFQSIDSLLGGPRLDELAGWRSRRAFLRKPQYNFGWDWALPLPSLGLAGEVWLETDHARRFVDLWIQTFIDGRVDVGFEVTSETLAQPYQIVLTVSGHGQKIIASPLPRTSMATGHQPDESVAGRQTHKSYLTIHIPDPQLWWPNGYGKANLYDYSVELIVGGHVVDRRQGRLGLREVRTVERPFLPEHGPGFSYEIQVNGQTIFCKGGNFIPTELWPGACRDEQYEYYLRKTAEANFNIQRIWGGGIYERDRFYELCDELGIMVWQDFMFAGAGYPLDRLRDEIIAEADHQIRRLRNHASICLWCGCNEDVFAWSYRSDIPAGPLADIVEDVETQDRWRVDRLHDDPQLYSMILRGLVSKLGLGVPYTESSPQSRDDAGNMPNSGNCHISSWKYALFEAGQTPSAFRGYADIVCSFNSEFCIQGPCSRSTFEKFLRPENLWPPNDAWVYHIQRGHKNLTHFEQTLFIAGDTFGPIDSLATYVKHGQATHAEMMRLEFESARRNRPDSGGTMMWMFNDCWPTANWSIIDYFRREKPCFFAAKRACEPILPMIVSRGDQLEFFVGNDSLQRRSLTLRYGQEALDGRELWERQTTLNAPANGTVRFDQLAKAELRANRGDFLFIDAQVDGVELPRVIYFPDGWRDVHWPEPEVKRECVSNEPLTDGSWRMHLVLSTKRFARFLHAITGLEEGLVTFSDNYFDLSAGARREIVIDSARKLDPEQLSIGHWLTDWP